MDLLYLLVETHGALVSELLRDGEAVRVPVATEKKIRKTSNIRKI